MDIERIKSELKAKQNELWMEFDSDPPIELLHYTGPNALRSIVTKNELWCTDFTQVNDPDEGHYGMDLVRLVSREKSIPDRFRYQLRQGDFGMKDMWTQYIACFCSGGEQDHMWSQYAKNGTGCALGFDYHKLFEEAANGTYALFPVLYDHSKQVELLKKTFDHAIHYARAINLSNRDAYEYWLAVVPWLVIYASRVKDAQKWGQEHEFRLMISGSYPTASTFESGGKRRLRVPFDPNAVTRVVRGRAAGEALSIEKLRAVLTEHGYRSDLSIDEADCNQSRFGEAP